MVTLVAGRGVLETYSVLIALICSMATSCVALDADS